MALPAPCTPGTIRKAEGSRQEAETWRRNEQVHLAEVRRWLEVEKVDPETIFAASGEMMIRYKDLIHHLEHETPDGKLLLFAICRGRVMKRSGGQQAQALLQIDTSRPQTDKPSGL